MKLKLFLLSILILLGINYSTQAQTSIPGDSLVYGPMFSPVYDNSVRVWVLTKSNTNSGNDLSLSFTDTTNPSTEISGSVYNSDSRLGYHLRSYEFNGLSSGETYTAKLLENGNETSRQSSITNETDIIDDFVFLSGGCGRIYDTSRCVDQPESEFHINGDPQMFNLMAEEDSDLMVWLGDAVYLLGLQHAMGQCPDAIDDWANKDMAFDRYRFYRDFHDSLTVAMPQLAITDNHDLGPNEFNKNMPTIDDTREIFMEWWPNPEYKSTPEGQGLFSSYVYKDVEFFLLDNRSYRDGTTQHLGPDQLQWLKDALSDSEATFKILINGTPSFEANCGGRNFCNTAQSSELITYIKEENINGVISFSADIHEQKFIIRDGDVKYPLYDILSGNINSDIGNGNYNINYGGNYMLTGVKHTFLRVSVYGEEQDRRMKVEYVGDDGVPYFEEIIHQDMLTSQNEDALKLALDFNNSVEDDSPYNHTINATNYDFGEDKDEVDNQAIQLTENSIVQLPNNDLLNFHDRAFSLTFWVNPDELPETEAIIFSNATATKGVSFGIDAEGKPFYTNQAETATYKAQYQVQPNGWSYITWKYDNVRRKLSAYYNGFLVQDWSNVLGPIASPESISIGRNYEGKNFIGRIDQLSFFGRLISDQEISEDADIESHRGKVLKMSGGQQMLIPSAITNNVLSEDFTIEFWAKLNSDPGTNHKILASNGRVDNNTTGISFEYPDSNKLNVVLGTDGSGWNSLSEQGEAWNIGEWNHVALSATKNSNIRYYVNGQFVAEGDFQEYIPNHFGLGFGYSPNYGSAVQAELDELRIWQKALSEEEIVTRMHYPLQGSEEDLAIYYDFNSHTDTSILSKGTIEYEMNIDGAELFLATSPVGEIEETYRDTVVGQWSKNNEVLNHGLRTTDSIETYISNIIIGKSADTTLDVVPGYEELYYNKGGWQVDAMNIASATLQVNLEEALPSYDSIQAQTENYYLLKEESGEFIGVAEAVQNGSEAFFENIPLNNSIYYLAWGEGTLNTELIDKSDIRIYPNPTGGKITIAINNPTEDKVTIEVFDLLGRRLATEYSAGGKQSISIDLSQYIQGSQLVLLQVNIGNKKYTYKVLKE